ncbi:ras guanine nucleotide exchange factor domain-containing protein [Mycena maculata]|uniref:Ras guanine nucleotide exchange factor domain-containing protein n=1 Tax=Mycena maculata TaxID=230809 RepID=A0AAD7KCF3_9AGAR|nr:ras guanine nucleotide exchange factor domain-containing protein [Mycena maculata]
MYSSSRLQIDTSIAAVAGPYSGKRKPSPNTLTVSSAIRSRLRSVSNASSSSSISIISPESSSTNASASASTSSLQLPAKTAQASVQPQTQSRPNSPAGSVFDETVRFGAEYVLAMHDYAPQHQNATCLSFRAGQVIHVLNRDSSGWWDGELEGRRGWFPSNYVNVDVNGLMEEEYPTTSPMRVRGHAHSSSTASTTSWVSTTSRELSHHSRRPSLSEALGPDIDSYCPPIMVPLLHGLSLLQSAVRANRVSHFQPSTACIISCVRSVLSATDTLVRDAPILHRFPALAQERRRILSVLASLVAQAKRASDETPDEESQEAQVDAMVRLGGQVFASVRRFLAVAVQCGVELPERRQSIGSIAGSTDTEGHSWSNESFEARTVSYGHGASGSYGLDGLNGRTPSPRKDVVANQGSALRARSMVDLRRASRTSVDDDSDSAVPLLPNGINIPAKTKQEQYLLKERVPRHKAGGLSVSSTSSSSSSFSSVESTPARPPFPVGPSSTAQVMDALRSTHDQYLSTIAAFIGHAHSHSRSSHASSTGHLYELVREIVEMVCKLLTIVDAVLQHPDVPTNKLGNLQAAKDGLYNVTSNLAESVRLLTVTVSPTMSEDEEKQTLLRSATGALKAGADCVAAVKMCLNRSHGEHPFVLHLPNAGERMSFTPSKFSKPTLTRSSSMGALNTYRFSGITEEEEADVTQRARLSPIVTVGRKVAEASSGSESSELSKSSSIRSQDTNVTSPDCSLPYLSIAPPSAVDPDLPSPTSFVNTDEDGTTWEGSRAHATEDRALEDKIFHGDLPSVPVDQLEPIPEFMQDPVAWMLSHDYSLEDVAYNTDGHLVGATMGVLVEKMTPHDSIVDPAFSAVFFLTFRLFSSPLELVDTIIRRYNLLPPHGISSEDVQLWQQRKGIPVRLRVSNFIKIWVEIYWRPGVDDSALEPLATFTQDGLAVMFPGPAQRIKDLIEMRRRIVGSVISPKSERTRDPGMSINPPSTTVPMGEIPRPMMTKTLLANLRGKNFAAVAITDFDPLELARQLTIMECNLYCSIQPEEVLETGQEGAKPPTNVKAVSSLSTAITGWVAESILSEPDTKKRTILVKFFIKVADRCTSLNNYSTPRSMLAALDSSTISRLHQTWLGLPQKNRSQLESLRRLADHSRNYHEYRSKLRNTAPPAVPFLGLYLTDVTFCREGNPSTRASPMNPEKKLLNFNKYHKLARIVQDMQRFQVPYQLRGIPEVQEYLTGAFENSRHHGDLQDLYRRSLLVEPKQAADTAPAADMRQLFSWATRSQATTPS